MRLASPCSLINSFFFFNAPAPTEIYTLSLHDALPILADGVRDQMSEDLLHAPRVPLAGDIARELERHRSEEHTSELQSPYDLVCRLLLEKKNSFAKKIPTTCMTMLHSIYTVMLLFDSV